MKAISVSVLFVLLLASSCSSVKKSQTSHKATTDSTHLVKLDTSRLVTVDSGQLQKKDSTGVTTEKNKTKTDVVIYFDSTINEYPSKPEDYYSDTVPKKKKTSIRVSLNEKGLVDVDLGNNKPTRIEIKHSGEYEKKDSSRINTTDSGYYHGKDSSNYNYTDSTGKKTTVADSSSSKSKFPWVAIMVSLALIFIFFILFALKRRSSS